MITASITKNLAATTETLGQSSSSHSSQSSHYSDIMVDQESPAAFSQKVQF